MAKILQYTMWMQKKHCTMIRIKQVKLLNHKMAARLANRLFQNNLIFFISILVPKPSSIGFQFFFLNESKIYCIFDYFFKKGVVLRNRTA